MSAAPVDLVSELRQQFISTLDDFLDALTTVFPECSGCRRLRLEFSMGVTHALTPELREEAETSLITTFYKELEPYLDMIGRRDERFFLECNSKTLQDVNLKEKWEDKTVDADTRLAIWEYCSQLANTAQLHATYNGMPPELIAQMQSMASGIMNDDGSVDFSAISLDSLENLGRTILAGKSKEEGEAFTQAMLKNASSVIGGSGESGGFNPASMLSALGGGGVADLLGMAMGKK